MSSIRHSNFYSFYSFSALCLPFGRAQGAETVKNLSGRRRRPCSQLKVTFETLERLSRNRKALYVKPFLEQCGTGEKPDKSEGKSDAFNTVGRSVPRRFRLSSRFAFLDS